MSERVNPSREPRRVLFVVDAFPDETHVWDGSPTLDQARAVARCAVVGVSMYRTWSPRQWIAAGGRFPAERTWRDGELDVFRFVGFVPTTRCEEWLIRARVRAVERAARLFERRYGAIDIVHAHCAAFAGQTALRVARRRGVPLVLTEHYSFLPDLVRTYGDALLRVYEQADLLLAGSHRLAAMMHDLGVRREIHRMPNAVDDTIFRPHRQEPPRDGMWKLLCVARDHEVKDLPTLVHAAARLARRERFELTVVGPGEYTEARALARQKGVADRVRFAGELSRFALAGRMRESHVIVSSSRIETFGMTLAEALCVGRPVVSTDSGGPRDTVRPVDGRLVPVGDAAALADALADVLASYRRFDLDEMSASARSRFGLAAFAGRLVPLYERLLPPQPEAGRRAAAAWRDGIPCGVEACT